MRSGCHKRSTELSLVALISRCDHRLRAYRAVRKTTLPLSVQHLKCRQQFYALDREHELKSSVRHRTCTVVVGATSRRRVAPSVCTKICMGHSRMLNRFRESSQREWQHGPTKPRFNFLFSRSIFFPSLLEARACLLTQLQSCSPATLRVHH
jgi:hypothetical protein